VIPSSTKIDLPVQRAALLVSRLSGGPPRRYPGTCPLDCLTTPRRDTTSALARRKTYKGVMVLFTNAGTPCRKSRPAQERPETTVRLTNAPAIRSLLFMPRHAAALVYL